MLLSTHRVFYVVTGDGIINQYRMDGQGDVIRTLNEFEDYTISAMTIDYNNNQLYFKVDNDDDPYALSRSNSDFTDLRRAVLDFRKNNFVHGHPLPPFAVYNGLLYLIIQNRGLLIFFAGGGIQCNNRQMSTPVYSTKIIHYERQPGKYGFYSYNTFSIIVDLPVFNCN